MHAEPVATGRLRRVEHRVGGGHHLLRGPAGLRHARGEPVENRPAAVCQPVPKAIHPSDQVHRCPAPPPWNSSRPGWTAGCWPAPAGCCRCGYAGPACAACGWRAWSGCRRRWRRSRAAAAGCCWPSATPASMIRPCWPTCSGSTWPGPAHSAARETADTASGPAPMPSSSTTAASPSGQAHRWAGCSRTWGAARSSAASSTCRPCAPPAPCSWMAPIPLRWRRRGPPMATTR